MTGPVMLAHPDAVFDDEADAPEPISYVLMMQDATGVQSAQLQITLIEARTMVTMPGGITLVNWLALRGITHNDVPES